MLNVCMNTRSDVLIVVKVGYSDHSYFCKVFKKSNGLSPSRYRRQFMGEEKGLT